MDHRREPVVKRIRAHCSTLVDREVALLRESDEHENVVRYFCTEQDRLFRYIAIEPYAATLEDYVDGKASSAVLEGTTVTLSQLREKISPLEILREATSGLMHLHALSIVHGDIKPQNILLSLPDKLECVLVKISDFWLSKKLNNGKESFSQNTAETGTNGWIAPEMKRGQRVTMSVDIFSLGCVFYYVLSGGCNLLGDSSTCQANILGKFNLGELWRKNTPSDNQTVLAKDIIRHMIQSDGSKRPSARAIGNHPLFWDNNRLLAFLLDVNYREEKSMVNCEKSDGEMRVGQIRFNVQNELGKGCDETVVFLGSFGGRKVAVKRIRARCFKLADCEVAALCKSDAHENVIRYYGTEQDRLFRYIAIELCAATLEDYVDGKASSAVPAATTVTLSKLRQKISPLNILQQATSGLMHLHALSIVHRDIKPQNILLSPPDKLECVLVKISDFGLSKKLNNGKESFSQNSGVTGTYGWIAPEMQRGQRVTMSVDIFSLGCVFYYVLSNGFHPFGEKEVCQINILSGDSALDKLRPDNNRDILAEEIIRDMLQSDGSKRPPARAIANHPLFWSNERVLAFPQDVSNWLKGLKNMTEPLRWLEKNASFVVRDDWIHHLDAVMKDGLCKVRGYKGDRVRDLLRAIRNHINHYNELTSEMQRALGTMPHEFTNYWISRFPHLLSHAYHAMANNSREPIFRQYYNDEEDNHTGGGSPMESHGGYKFTPPAYFHEDDKDNDELTNERATDMKKGNKSPSDGGSAEAGKMLTGRHNNKRRTCKSGNTMSGGFITRQQVRENDSGALDDQRASVQGADAGGENDAISDGGVNQRRRYVTATGPGNPNSTSVTQNNTGKRRRKRKSKAK